ncbi:MAG: efflux RND transporter periplasmic adaptor subunit [Fimbriimonadaceae bacterium]|jgi:RND family efflux transporter MFP subunit|nr:efflux RND transporter periplasmic adaptor subunit [Fimbriimonadaceae bacterium]
MHTSLKISSSFILACASLILLPGCVDREAQKQAQATETIVKDPTIPVQVTQASVADIAETLELTGSLVAGDDVTVAAKGAGRLTSVFVREGDSVRAGQVVAQQETADLQARAAQARAGIDAARAQLQQALADANISPERSDAGVRAAESRLRQAREQLAKAEAGARSEERRQAQINVDRAKSDLTVAERNLKRARNLFAEGAISQAEVELAENRYDNAMAGYQAALEGLALTKDAVRPEDIATARESVRQAEQDVRQAQANKRLDVVLPQRVQAARANVTSAQEALRQVQIAIADQTIRSPFSGKVSGRPLQTGTFAGPGTPILRLIGSEGIYYEAQVPEASVAKIQPGMEVSVKVEALGNLTLTGRVRAINPLATDVGRLFSVRVELTEQLGNLKAGMFARGTLQLGMRPQAVTVPTEAIVRSGSDTFLYILEGTKAKRVPVTLGAVQNGRTEVTGIAAGATLVTRGQANLFDGAEVKVEAQGTAAPAPSGQATEAGA